MTHTQDTIAVTYTKMFSKICLSALLISFASALSTDYSASDYVREFGRNYADATEALMRMTLIEKRLEEIRQHPSESSYTLALNELTDRTDAELGQLRMRGYKKSLYAKSKPLYGATQRGKMQQSSTRSCGPVPEVFSHCDWRDSGIITPTKNQGACGSCWTFATAESVESFFALSHGYTEELSEQQLVDCVTNPQECGGTGGCAGATMDIGFEYIKAAGGLTSEWRYPYESGRSSKEGACAFDGAGVVAKVTGWVDLPVNDQEAIMEALAFQGPLAISVDASAWHAYGGGVFSGCNHDDVTIDHAVQLVGYGTDEITKLPYWLIRNSWGTSWGEGGYIRLLRQPNTAACYVDKEPFDGVDCKKVPNPVTQVTVCGECGILYAVSYPIVEGPAPKATASPALRSSRDGVVA